MWTDIVNKSVYHQLTTSQLTVCLFLVIFKHQFPYGENEVDFYYWKLTVVLFFKPVFLCWAGLDTQADYIRNHAVSKPHASEF